ncbi:MAG: hypothetical protein EXS13_08140 [Planctomycetes bacterium]|nr:hypothetical protein [Planctomycetota bacterium]
MNPGQAEVLLRFPQPPSSYVRFAGANPLTNEPLFVRRGTTVFSVVTDTTTLIHNVRTLVVTDRGARDSIDGINNDAWNLCTQVHEGFHAFADRALKIPAYSELDMADYPDLEPERSARLQLEGDALIAALAAEAPDEREEQALLFLAERVRRRDGLPAAVVRAEDGNEMNEGLATYVEWRALELWRDHGISKELQAAMPQFKAAQEFTAEVKQHTIQLRHLARHTLAVNGSEFGTAVVRRRAYFFGGALGRLLDALSPEWKRSAEQGRTLTESLVEALGAPSDEELAERAAAAEDDAAFAELVAAKAKQSARATQDRERTVARVIDGAGTLLRIDVSSVAGREFLPSSYTPFGIVRVDANRRLFWMAPTNFTIGAVTVRTLRGDVAIIADDERQKLLVRTPAEAADVIAALTRPAAPDTPAYRDSALEIEGVVEAVTTEADGSVVVRLASARGG